MRFLHKTAAGFMALGLLFLAGCGTQDGESSGAAISFTKEGKIRAEIRESFEQSYYDKDELQKTILAEAADHNHRAGDGSITVEKVEVENGMALVSMTYAKAEDYASFNQVDFFAGSPEQAQAAGYDLNVVLSSVKNESDTIGKSDILAMKDATILITDEKDAIALNGKALYVSDNVAVSQNEKQVQRTGEENGLAYIIFK